MMTVVSGRMAGATGVAAVRCVESVAAAPCVLVAAFDAALDDVADDAVAPLAFFLATARLSAFGFDAGAPPGTNFWTR